VKKTPIIAIGLDATDPILLEKWMSQGHLKTLNKIRHAGIYGRLNNTVKYCDVATEIAVTELLWVMFSTGCQPLKTGYWDVVKYDSDSYTITCDMTKGGYDYKEYPPFYALGDNYKIAVFDLPVTAISKEVNGIQTLGWGGHYPYTPSHSNPPELLPEIIQKYGNNPILFNDDGIWWDKAYIKWLEGALERSISSRAAICRDLLKREPWDLFLAVFGEPHTVGHDLYNRSQPDHPLYPYLTKGGTAPDPLLKTYECIDRAIEEILTEVPENAYLLFFSVHGMGSNFSDLLSMACLPELLYRFSFPGKVAIAPGKLGTTPPATVTKPIRRSWTGEVWARNYEPNFMKRFLRPWVPSKFLRSEKNGLASPYPLMEQSVDMGWMPARWYQLLWSKMKAFALPSFTTGQIRINLQEREREGIVTASEYELLCEELTQMLYRLKDGRTGEPIVKKVIRTRRSATDNDPKLPDSDLVVFWCDRMTDVVDSPDFGRIGPLTHFRAGGHREEGFLMVKGPGITPGSSLLEGEAIDLAPTILELMGAPIPEYFDGKSLLKFLVATS